ncbi:MAG: SDR family oxidoreductase [Novosphingobium sp.]|nr:SDR family oxidoreductase [Novosphingobium sp.]
MTDRISGKTIIITGAGSGFGALASRRLAARGGKLVCCDIDAESARMTVDAIIGEGGEAIAATADVSSLDAMRAVAALAVDTFGSTDVLVNNAGIMPLAFLADHVSAAEAWARCIDINFKGVVNGTCAVHDQMIAQGHGQIVNMSSIFGNVPVMGGSVYGATKAAVDYFSHSVRQESRGKIKVTVIKPTGVNATNLGNSVVNGAAAIGALGANYTEYRAMLGEMVEGTAPGELSDPESIAYASLAPEYIVDAIVHAIDQPWGVSVSDITVRASGDHYVM